MPYKDHEKQLEYMRNYRRDERALFKKLKQEAAAKEANQ